MDLRLQHKLALKQILTPQVIQTMELIQLPILELSNKLKQELVENPMLEIKKEKQEEIKTESLDHDNSSTSDLIAYKKLFDGLQNMDSESSGAIIEDEEDFSPIERVPFRSSLFDYLIDQLHLNDNSERINDLAEFIIGNLDDHGMLNVSLEELLEDAERLDIVEKPTLKELNEALEEVQQLDPPGIGARDLRESYLLQMGASEDFDSLAYIIVRDYFDILGKKNLPEMEKILGESSERIKEALHKIYLLQTKPIAEATKYEIAVEPDIEIKKIDGRWQVIYNSFDIPELSISKYYMNLLRKTHELKDDIKIFLKKKLDSAKWWIDALHMRRENMINTMKTIIKFQEDFFEKGPEFIKPMKMEEIAHEIGVHPATISRLSKDKYVQTPHGVFPVKYFFTRGLATDTGDDMSTRVIKGKIAEYIERENKAKPLSDQNIADILFTDGIQIARRTVAKYRELLGYPSARMRKLN